MRLKIIPALLLFIFISSYVYANNGDEFKSICSVIAKDFSELMSFENPDDVPADLEKRAEDNFILQAQRLKEFVQLNPNSIWADDAQYVLSVLKAGYPGQEVVELEYLLEHYPDMTLEKWTKENLSWLISVDLQLAARFTLLMHYKKSGEKDKLNALYDESIKKLPEKKEQFKKIINYKK